MRAGLFRPLTLWPFPIRLLRPLLDDRAERIVVVEASDGQLEDELRLALCHAGVAGHRADRAACAATAASCRPQTRDRGGASARDAEGDRGGGGMSVFYERFERHAHGEGLKGAEHPLLPGLRPRPRPQVPGRAPSRSWASRTARSPSRRSAAPSSSTTTSTSATPRRPTGARPAVALGHKLANPESIVISYQGDGDLASIGLAEILQAAQLGIPITVIFVNNAIYGMTGGQMAPTTLMGQKTATSPDGRDRLMGEPLRMAEMIAELDGPVYVERVALFDAKQRVKAAEGDPEGPPAAGREPGLRLRRGPRRVPDPPPA